MTTSPDKDPTMIAQRQFYRSLGVREYDEPKRCGKCRTKNYVRTVAGVCLVCVMKKKGKK